MGFDLIAHWMLRCREPPWAGAKAAAERQAKRGEAAASTVFLVRAGLPKSSASWEARSLRKRAGPKGGRLSASLWDRASSLNPLVVRPGSRQTLPLVSPSHRSAPSGKRVARSADQRQPRPLRHPSLAAAPAAAPRPPPPLHTRTAMPLTGRLGQPLPASRRSLLQSVVAAPLLALPHPPRAHAAPTAAVKPVLDQPMRRRGQLLGMPAALLAGSGWCRPTPGLWWRLVKLVKGRLMHPAAPHPACNIDQETLLPLCRLRLPKGTVGRDYVLLQLKLGGQGPFDFVVDTGLTAELITPHLKQVGAGRGERRGHAQGGGCAGRWAAADKERLGCC